MSDKTQLSSRKNILVGSGLSGKTISGIEAYTLGSVEVVEIVHSTGTQFVKFRHGQVEIGGTNEWDTGTKVG